MNLGINQKKIIIGTFIILVFLLLIFKINSKEAVETPKLIAPKIVSTIEIGSVSPNNSTINAIGSVKADSKISLVAMQTGTVRAINFNIGDKVITGQRLISLSENSISTSLLNAQTDHSNKTNNLEIVKTSSDQNIQSSEIALDNASKAVELSTIQVKAAQDNYDNGLIQVEKNKADLQNNSVINFNNNLSTLFDLLNQIDYIIKADGDEQIYGIEKVIAAKNKQSLSQSKISYFEAKDCYNNLLTKTTNPDQALTLISQSLACIQKTKIAVDDLIIVLENTVSSSEFSKSTINTQISKFNQLRISLLGAESATKQIEQSLENIEINSKADLDRLENNLALAHNQLNLSEIGYENALLGIEKTKSLKDQQIVSAQIAKDSSLGQLYLARERALDLNILSPINGIITKKSLEIGEEVAPGKILAEVSQLNLIKIIVRLSSEEAYKVKIGTKVIIEEKYNGFISQINPAADALSKKVEIEIAFDNSKGNLIAETFVNVEIPTEKNIKSKNGFFLIPMKAISITQNENFIYIIEDGLAIKKEVETGEIQNTLIEIVSGLNEGDNLVVDGNKNLNNLDKVETE